ncbi:endolytic transglycosylase MltG [Streptomyces echinatus]|uniref:Endolytic murein transglycosylase n=1 Tax=Streptomyces echinatus TaxID=67293 RepID=A0A7W9PQG2_9ACTN|nr:endolytic transglycosylase MltG [Streptomyces echinatus]MBB5926050.1 cell division protein YceG involved in septum cleavage [Streptomyces echinatus]
MQTNTPSRSRIRLTRRGRLAVVVAGAVVAGAAVAVPLLTLATDHEQAQSAMLVIPEGWRSGQVYDAIDKALALPPGSTRKSLDKAALHLPGEAGGNPEGYLLPATYPVRKGATPESLLRAMVDNAKRKYDAAPVAAGAQREAMNVYQTVTIASIVQAEAGTKVDMGKVARVVYNRLQSGMPLQMDSTINYALNRSTVRTSQDDAQLASPYNSYQRTGLPPTPIDNPGEQAMRAALNPTPGDWLYYVTVRPGDTRFTADYNEHLKNVADFNAAHQDAATQPSDSGAPALPASPGGAGS